MMLAFFFVASLFAVDPVTDPPRSGDATLTVSDYRALASACWDERSSQAEGSTMDDIHADQYRQLAAALRYSDDIEDQIARALIGQMTDSQTVESAMHRAMEIDPDNPLLLELAVSTCGATATYSWCNQPLAERWLNTEPENLNAHLSALSEAWPDGRFEQAQDILLRAALQASTETPVGSLGATVANALAQEFPTIDLDATVLAGLGVELALPVAYQHLIDACTGSDRADVHRACLRISELLMASVQRMMSQSLGFSLLTRLRDHYPDMVTDRAFREAQGRHELLHRLHWQSNYLICDRGIREADWFRLILEFGEIGAFERIVGNPSVASPRPPPSGTEHSVTNPSSTDSRPATNQLASRADSAESVLPPGGTDSPDIVVQRSADRSWLLSVSLILLIGAVLARRLLRK